MTDSFKLPDVLGASTKKGERLPAPPVGQSFVDVCR